ncbi:hypothetical protein B7463_g3092, partial [Scytalidium lignicola]
MTADFNWEASGYRTVENYEKLLKGFIIDKPCEVDVELELKFLWLGEVPSSAEFRAEDPCERLRQFRFFGFNLYSYGCALVIAIGVPRICADIPPATKLAYVRFYKTAGLVAGTVPKGSRTIISSVSSKRSKASDNGDLDAQDDRERRIQELKDSGTLEYPRIKKSQDFGYKEMTCRGFTERYTDLKPAMMLKEDNVVLRGRIHSVRLSGSKLVFLDLVQDGERVQAVFDLKRLQMFSNVTPQQFRRFYRIFRRGDIISVLGAPYRTPRGELSITVSELPRLLTPSLMDIPAKLEHSETRVRNRHVDLLVNTKAADTLRLRSSITQYIRDFLLKDSFLEVQTPIIADKAGGAVARPFTTSATEFPEKELALRIAPELWLKRLILGGFDRVFEIGPAFRNEGLDATHNPEFMTCEFYKSFTDLEELMSITEQMISGLASHVKSLQEGRLKSLPEMDVTLYEPQFKRIEFIPEIEAELGQALPDLSKPDASNQLINIFTKHSIALPSPPTLPRLLDKLCSIYIEPNCTTPTFIIHHPSCMSPLSKSFICPKTSQSISARAELFISNREVANMYEEENSPFAQREKFIEQGKYKDEENQANVDQSYVEALEWGLPPTGGWGAGIERLVMLMSGQEKISDVLSFGNLRHVVGIGSGVKRKENGEETEP